MGQLRFRELSKYVKESDFTSEVGSKAIASFESQFQLVVESLDNAVGELFFGFEIIEQQMAMGLESAGHPLEGFEAAAGDASAPGVEKLSGPGARRIGPKMLKALYQQESAQSAQSAAHQLAHAAVVVGVPVAAVLEKGVQRVFWLQPFSNAQLWANLAIRRIARQLTKVKRNYNIKTMKLIVIGGTGLIGTKVVKGLREKGHEVVAASPSQGINSVTGEGLAEALVGAQVVVDVSNSPSWEDKAVLEFFETSERNLAAAEAAAGVGHHVALSVVGTERLLASGYFRAKLAQENLIKASSIPYTIVRATQFFEFVGGIAQSATEGQTASGGYDAAYRIGRCRRRLSGCGPCGAVE